MVSLFGMDFYNHFHHRIHRKDNRQPEKGQVYPKFLWHHRFIIDSPDLPEPGTRWQPLSHYYPNPQNATGFQDFETEPLPESIRSTCRFAKAK